jgi:hypothetical protein
MWEGYLVSAILQLLVEGRPLDASVFREFDLSTCSYFEAHRSDSLILVCRSALKANRFLLEKGGYIEKPSELDEAATTLLSLAVGYAVGFTIPQIDPNGYNRGEDTWKAATKEFIRATYGANASLYFFEPFPYFNDANSSHYRFEVRPGDKVPPWGAWGLPPKGPVVVKVEVLDDPTP